MLFPNMYTFKFDLLQSAFILWEMYMFLDKVNGFTHVKEFICIMYE